MLIIDGMYLGQFYANSIELGSVLRGPCTLGKQNTVEIRWSADEHFPDPKEAYKMELFNQVLEISVAITQTKVWTIETACKFVWILIQFKKSFPKTP